MVEIFFILEGVVTFAFFDDETVDAPLGTTVIVPRASGMKLRAPMVDDCSRSSRLVVSTITWPNWPHYRQTSWTTPTSSGASVSATTSGPL